MAKTGLSWRVAIGALILTPLNAWWLTETEYIRYSDNATTQALFFNAVSVLLFLAAGNRLLGALRPAWRLAPGEIALLYTGVVAASNLGGHDVLQILFTTIAYPYHQAQITTDWKTQVLPHLTPSLVITDPEALRGLFSGNTTLYRPDHWRPLLVPLGLWTLFSMTLVWTLWCLTCLLRKRWESERLAYPIVELPLQLATGETAVFRQPLLWVGAAIGAANQIVNMVHSLYPQIPGIPTGVQYWQSETFPWNAAGPIPTTFYPFAYGMAFLLPTALGFSCWFFFFLSRAELVLAAMAGYTEAGPWGKFPYIQQQGVGAVYGIALALLWTSRAYLGRVVSAALGASDAEDDADEPLSYRVALIGFLAGVAALVGFSLFAGLRWQTALWFLTLLLLIILVVARLRAELGLPTFELFMVGPDHILHTAGGARSLQPGEWGAMALFYFVQRTHRQFPMQHQVDAAQLGKRTGVPPRALSAFLMVISLWGIVCAFWALSHSLYRTGFESGKFLGPALPAFGRTPWQVMTTRLTSGTPPDPQAVGAYFFGGAFALVLAAMRIRFVWWPFHPAGYLVSGSFGLFRLWLPLFVSWALKTLILRYGGLGLYRKALPFFLGMIVGEFTAGFVRSVLDLTLGLYLPPSSGIGGL